MATGLVRYRENRAGVRAMLCSQEVRDDTHRRGENVADFARSIAPVRTGRYKGLTKQYGRGGFYVISGIENGVPYTDVTNPTPYAYFLERGTRYMRAQHILGRSLQAARE